MGKLALIALVPAILVPGAAQAAESHCGQDETYLKTSIQGDRFEVAGGKLALQKSTNPKVRTLAQTLITDHSKSLKDAIALARRLGVTVPKTPSESQQWELGTVAGFNGNAFDRSWSDLERLDHIQDISETKDEVKTGCNSAVRKAARKEIPTLKKHLKLAKEALASTSP
jgi:putative membrane protein